MRLLRFQKPSRYIDREWNSLHKEGDLKIALCFPDLYEIGMSHLGLRILYDILNSMEGVVAERVFAPGPDMEEHLRKNRIGLTSLESRRPLKDFDIIGFSLQYELSITTVLNMLDLSGIPVLRNERKGLPLVIAGGPCTVNPAPFNRFFDALFIGEAEDAVTAMVRLLKGWKSQGDGRKESLLKALSSVEGFYVPDISSGAKRVFVEDINTAPYPLRPVVSHQAIHDRLNIEISRGCPKGCRFCQAGMIYRPVRERTFEKVIEIAELSLPLTGYEEVSLTSLSAGDYKGLPDLLHELNRRFSNKRISLSLPSLRVGAVTKEILTELKAVRKTGFTIAPEAGTERLRSVINKEFSEDDYERTLMSLFGEGWLNLKLYFMIGLPTERPEDLEGIIRMALKALKVAKRYTNKFVNINVSISPFIPKPHTPFQWCGFGGIEELRRKTEFLKENLKRKGINYRGHEPEMSLIEAIISRGDETIGDIIYWAWRLGSRLDAWGEYFHLSRWTEAMERTGIDGIKSTTSPLHEEAPLHWDMIDSGIKKEFLLREFKKALASERTPGCEKVCSACGIECKTIQKSEAITPLQSSAVTLSRHRTKIRLRAVFSKTGLLKYLSHLELIKLIERGLRRADIPLEFTEGFSPSPILSFGPALPLGVAGLREYFDMVVDSCIIKQYLTMQSLVSSINNVFPEDIRLKDLFIIPLKTPSLDQFIRGYEYLIIFHEEELRQRVDLTQEASRALLKDFDFSEKGLRLLLIDRDNKKVRIFEYLKEIGIPEKAIEEEQVEVIRIGVFGILDDNLITPEQLVGDSSGFLPVRPFYEE